MELTGKCKEEFEKWYVITYFKDSIPLSIQEHCAILESFSNCFKSMRYGVLVDYFDSVGLFIGLDSWRTCGNKKETFFWYNIRDVNQESLIKETYKDSMLTAKNKERGEARYIAIEKANELRNEVLNKQVWK